MWMMYSNWRTEHVSIILEDGTHWNIQSCSDLKVFSRPDHACADYSPAQYSRLEQERQEREFAILFQFQFTQK